MKRLQNKYVNEFFDRSNEKQKRHRNAMYLFAILPATLLIFYALMHMNVNQISNENSIIIALSLSAMYPISMIGIILIFDCWTIAEMVSPSVLGRYRKIKTFFSILADSPTRQEILRTTKLYNDVLEKNGLQNYLSTSEFVKNIYDTQDKQNHKIDDIITDVMRELKINRLAFSKEHNLRIIAERKLEKEKQLTKKLTRLIITLSKIIKILKEEIKRLKGE